jgi:hypothetical protein
VEVPNTEALIKNLSASGMCITGTGCMDMVPKKRYSVNIIPEEDSNVGEFSLEIESRWVRAKISSSESGLVIIIPPGASKHEALEQYLCYLAAQPDSEETENSDVP